MPNNSFKPNLLRYTNNMAGKACHVAGSATQVGLTQVLGATGSYPQFLVKIIDSPGATRRVAVPVGAVMSFLSALALWFLFSLKNYSSVLRDNFEQPPGAMEYAVFALVCAALLFSFWLGICTTVLGARRQRGA